MELSGQALLFCEDGLDLFFDRVPEIWRRVQIAVVPFDGVLDLPGRQMRQAANPFLSSAAEEVAVVLPVATLDLGVDESSTSTGLLAAVAEDHAFEVVDEDTIAGAAAGPSLEYLLYAVKEVLAN